MVRIHDLSTNEVIDREMTEAEFAIYEVQQAKDNAKAEVEAQAVADKAALLAKLGITVDEAKLLLS